MKFFDKEHRFTNFLLVAFAAVVLNYVSSALGGYSTPFSSAVFIAGSLILIGLIILFKRGYEVAAKISSAIFFNAFFFTLTYYYGLQTIIFIYYFPFLVSYLYMYKDDATKAEARFFTYTCLVFILFTFYSCTMGGIVGLTPGQVAYMFKKNFVIASALSAYYFNAIFSYLMLQTKLAQEASSSKARFLSIMSHELRTPLNGIISAINLMETTDDQKEKRNFGHVLKSSSEHLLHLVNNVLDYSKASAGKMELSQVSSSIYKLLWNLQAVFQSRFNEKNLELELLIDEELKKNVLLDDIRFVQVLTNLISNALKFTEKGKAIIQARCVTLNDSTIEVEISITDTGKGLNDEQQQRIFESFNTVDKQARKVESSGLGLSISQMIVEMLGGTLLLDSELNVGSKFYFRITLPLVYAEEKKTAEVTIDSLLLEGATVLIAEDNPINMMVSVAFVKKWKAIPLQAINGIEAQQLLLTHPAIDLLLLDLQMPEMNGYELVEWIKEARLTLPVLAFTAQIMSAGEKQDLIRLGFTDMIPKPFAPEELRLKLVAALANSTRALHPTA